MGENFAAAFLKQQGYKVLVRNYSCPWGELDLVCRHEGVLAVVEVKTRGEGAWGAPAETVTRTKQRRIIRTTYHYLHELGDTPAPPVRFDIVEVFWVVDRPHSARLLSSAFELPPYPR